MPFLKLSSYDLRNNIDSNELCLILKYDFDFTICAIQSPNIMAIVFKFLIENFFLTIEIVMKKYLCFVIIFLFYCKYVVCTN